MVIQMALFSEGDYQGVSDWFQMDEHGKQAQKDMQNGKAPDLSKMSRDMQFTVKCSAGLLGDTPVLLSGTSESDIGEPTITTMRNVFTVHANKNLPIFATAKDLEGNRVAVPSHMMGIPKELYTDQYVEFKLSNGYALQAAEGLEILKENGEFGSVANMKVGDKVIIFDFNPNAPGGVEATTADIIMVNKKKSLSNPIYLFMAEHGNMLLPYVKPDGTGIQLIPINQ